MHTNFRSFKRFKLSRSPPLTGWNSRKLRIGIVGPCCASPYRCFKHDKNKLEFAKTVVVNESRRKSHEIKLEYIRLYI